jgi:hypothetical protein
MEMIRKNRFKKYAANKWLGSPFMLVFLVSFCRLNHTTDVRWNVKDVNEPPISCSFCEMIFF